MLSKELQLGKAAEHLACADLILKGYNAFLADQGLPFDLICEQNGHLWRVQVRSTQKPLSFNSRTVNPSTGKIYIAPRHCYRFGLRSGRNQKEIDPKDVDVFAFVALDTRQIAYMTTIQLAANGNIPRIIEFSPDDVTGNRRVKTWGRRIADFGEFPND